MTAKEQTNPPLPLPLPLPLPFDFRFLVPSAAAEPVGKPPKGAAHMDVRRFRKGQDAPSENSHRVREPAAGGREEGRAFFGSFFARAKKEPARQRGTFLLHRRYSTEFFA